MGGDPGAPVSRVLAGCEVHGTQLVWRREQLGDRGVLVRANLDQRASAVGDRGVVIAIAQSARSAIREGLFGGGAQRFGLLGQRRAESRDCCCRVFAFAQTGRDRRCAQLVGEVAQLHPHTGD